MQKQVIIDLEKLGQLGRELNSLLGSRDPIRYAPFEYTFFDRSASPYVMLSHEQFGGFASYSSNLHTRYSPGVGLAISSLAQTTTVINVLTRIYEQGLERNDQFSKALLAGSKTAKAKPELTVVIDTPDEDEKTSSDFPCLIAGMDNEGLDAMKISISTKALIEFQNSTNLLCAVVRITDPKMPFLKKLIELAYKADELESKSQDDYSELMKFYHDESVEFSIARFNLEKAIEAMNEIIANLKGFEAN